MNINIMYDDEASVWIAMGKGIGIFLEDESYDKLVEKVKMALPEMLELNGYPKNQVVYLCTKRQVINA